MKKRSQQYISHRTATAVPWKVLKSLPKQRCLRTFDNKHPAWRHDKWKHCVTFRRCCWQPQVFQRQEFRFPSRHNQCATAGGEGGRWVLRIWEWRPHSPRLPRHLSRESFYFFFFIGFWVYFYSSFLRHAKLIPVFRFYLRFFPFLSFLSHWKFNKAGRKKSLKTWYTMTHISMVHVFQINMLPVLFFFSSFLSADIYTSETR